MSTQYARTSRNKSEQPTTAPNLVTQPCLQTQEICINLAGYGKYWNSREFGPSSFFTIRRVSVSSCHRLLLLPTAKRFHFHLARKRIHLEVERVGLYTRNSGDRSNAL